LTYVHLPVAHRLLFMYSNLTSSADKMCQHGHFKYADSDKHKTQLTNQVGQTLLSCKALLRETDVRNHWRILTLLDFFF